MSSDRTNQEDTEILEKLLKAARDDAERESQRQKIDMQRAKLSAQYREALENGDERLCDEIARRQRELLEARRQIG